MKQQKPSKQTTLKQFVIKKGRPRVEVLRIKFRAI